MREPAALLERLDRLMAELQAIRDEVVAENQVHLVSADDLSPEHLLDTTSAAARFGYPRDTIALWCRQGCGTKVGGRWMVSVPKLQRRLNGG